MPVNIIETQKINFKYPDGTLALNDISIDIEKGKKTAILGANGSGKSTLFMHFNAIFKPLSGKVLFNGKELEYNHKFISDLRSKVGIVFQDPDSQLFSANVYQEVSFGPMNIIKDKEKVKHMVINALKSTDTFDIKDKPIHFLSYGQKKRVSIAGIVAMKPELIVFDEPTEFLDPVHKQQIISLMDKLNREGHTIVISTHDVNIAYEWADNIILINDGKKLCSGLPAEVFSNYELMKKSNLEKPLILQIFDIISPNLPVNSACPRNKIELTELINKNLNQKFLYSAII